MSADIQTSLRSPAAYDRAHKAIEVMAAHRVWPTVRNFTIWVHYVSESASPLAREIDRLLAAGEPITETVGETRPPPVLPEAQAPAAIPEDGARPPRATNTDT